MSRGLGRHQRAILKYLKKHECVAIRTIAWGLYEEGVIELDTYISKNRSLISSLTRAAHDLENKGQCQVIRIWGQVKLTEQIWEWQPDRSSFDLISMVYRRFEHVPVRRVVGYRVAPVVAVARSGVEVKTWIMAARDRSDT